MEVDYVRGVGAGEKVREALVFRGLRRKVRRVVFGLSGRSGFDILEG